VNFDLYPVTMTDDQLLLEIQRRAVRFFWEQANPVTGLVSDRANNFGDDHYTVASCAATGYGLAALPIGVEHGWIGRRDAIERARITLHFLLSMPHIRGWMAHFVFKSNGQGTVGTEYSSIDTALLVAGALVAGRYFQSDASGEEIQSSSQELYRRLDWLWILTNNQTDPAKRIISHGWLPEKGFLPYNYGSYSEAILLYLLGLGANRSLPADAWNAFERPLQNYEGIESLKGGPIFIHEMPSGYFYFRKQRDALGFDYWVSSTRAIQIHRRFCQAHARDSETYAHGFWGLNASDGPNGYTAYGAPDGPADGTVSPSGAIGALPFAPVLAASAARLCYETLGPLIWGRYGFSNAFNLDRDWYDSDVIGIDLGMLLLAIENHRTGLIWSLMGESKAAVSGFRKGGFRFTVEPEPRPVFLPEPNSHDRRIIAPP
jgi:hypothetical protein